MTNLAIYPSLYNKVVLISGGAEGIGAASVELFCKQKSKVIFLDYSADSAENLVKRIQHMPDTSLPTFISCDVTDLNKLKECTNKIISDYGTVDVLVNNAGSAGINSLTPTSEVTPESFERDINVNLRHQFFLTQFVMPSMKKQRSGSIINLGSITWRIPATGLPIYTASKAAIVGLTNTHSKELGEYGIRVNSIMPGAISTERQIREIHTDAFIAKCLASQSLKRAIMPEEVASLILFLAAHDSSAITGCNYVVDGGWVGNC
ncbi:hypothetical protein ZTR_00807 [Talaromyces verruculosus]|nr:hypothetical protein ZTR_00807 [Talaromyces verruculosus]